MIIPFSQFAIGIKLISTLQMRDEKEGPVTKSIRLTASLILKNLVIYSSLGRSWVFIFGKCFLKLISSYVSGGCVLTSLTYRPFPCPMLSQVGQSLKYCLKWRVPRTSEWPQLTFLTRISWLWPVNYFYMKKYDENWKLEQSWEAAAFTPPPASSPGQVVTTCSECDLNQYVDTCSTAETLQNIAVLHPSSFILITTTSAESISKQTTVLGNI